VSLGAGISATPGRTRAFAGLAIKRATAEAADLFLAGDFERARHAFRRVALAGHDVPGAARACHSWGRCELALGRPGAARVAFARALTGAPLGRQAVQDLRAYALAGLADAALASGHSAQALDHLQRITDEGLTGRLAADGLLFRRASALDGLGRARSAARDYRRLARTWPSSALAAGALARADTLGFHAASRQAPAPSSYEVRAGVYSDRNSAEKAAGALRDSGFRPRIAAASVGRTESFVVSIGKYDLREDAERAARKVTRAGFPARVSP
jgi:tetratricopeptide (TPR) repeat protein